MVTPDQIMALMPAQHRLPGLGVGGMMLLPIPKLQRPMGNGFPECAHKIAKAIEVIRSNRPEYREVYIEGLDDASVENPQ